jgi:hypothetical protein
LDAILHVMSASTLKKLLSAGAAVVATAAPEFNTRGNRFKPLTYAELTSEQRAFADKEIAKGRTASRRSMPA